MASILIIGFVRSLNIARYCVYSACYQVVLLSLACAAHARLHHSLCFLLHRSHKFTNQSYSRSILLYKCHSHSLCLLSDVIAKWTYSNFIHYESEFLV